mgnify:FL=1
MFPSRDDREFFVTLYESHGDVPLRDIQRVECLCREDGERTEVLSRIVICHIHRPMKWHRASVAFSECAQCSGRCWSLNLSKRTGIGGTVGGHHNQC